MFVGPCGPFMRTDAHEDRHLHSGDCNARWPNEAAKVMSMRSRRTLPLEAPATKRHDLPEVAVEAKAAQRMLCAWAGEDAGYEYELNSCGKDLTMARLGRCFEGEASKRDTNLRICVGKAIAR